MKRPLTNSPLLTRLVVMIALVITPILLATLFFANSHYRQNLDFIERAREQLTNSFAVRSRIWLTGSARTLLATYAALAAGEQDNATCSAVISAYVLANSDYRAAYVSLPDGRICAGSSDRSVGTPELARIATLETRGQPVDPLAESQGAVSRYETLLWNEQPLVVIRLNFPSASGTDGTALLLADGSAIESVFETARPGEAEFALIHKDGMMIARRAMPGSGQHWLPAAPPVTAAYTRFSGLERSGATSQFAIMPVVGTPFAIAARLSPLPDAEAWQQYVVMTVTPIIVAFILLAAYVAGLRHDVLRWIMGLRNAAKAWIRDPQSVHLAPMGEDMPSELRTTVEAFNQMVNQTNQREDDLRRALDHNRFLMRELHHRVKNSLQVIRSYLSLSQRTAGSAKKWRDIAGTEARVLVLAVAYRLALTDEGMRPVALGSFVEEVVASLSAILRQPSQEVTVRAEVVAGLEVDRAIPLGLAIVEHLIIAFGASAAAKMTVTLEQDEGDRIDLVVATGLPDEVPAPDARIMRGLALQLEATAQPMAVGEQLRWRFTAR